MKFFNNINDNDKQYIVDVLKNNNVKDSELPMTYKDNFWISKDENDNIICFFCLKLFNYLNKNKKHVILEYCWLDKEYRNDKNNLTNLIFAIKRKMLKFKTDLLIIDAKKHLKDKIISILNFKPYAETSNNIYFLVHTNYFIKEFLKKRG